MTEKLPDLVAKAAPRSDIAQVAPPVALTIVDEIKPGDPSAWIPQSYEEWESQERTRTFLDAWSEQVRDERTLRRTCAKWIFGLIAFQVAGVFGLAISQGLNWLQLDVGLLKLLLPTILTNVFGLGFLVVKYLFSQPMRHSLDSLAAGAKGTTSTPRRTDD